MSRIAVVTEPPRDWDWRSRTVWAQRLAPEDIVYLTGRGGGRVRPRPIGWPTRERGCAARCSMSATPTPSKYLRPHWARATAAWTSSSPTPAARLTPETASAQLMGRFVDTNNLGATRVLRAFDPITRANAHLLVVASEFGSLRNLPEQLHACSDTNWMTLDDVDTVMRAWRDAVVDGRASQEGWPGWINIPSKVGQVAAVRVLARQRRTANPRDRTLVVAVCPGLIDTAASRPWFDDMSAAQTPAQAVEALLIPALEPAADQRLHGELVQFGEIIPWR